MRGAGSHNGRIGRVVPVIKITFKPAVWYKVAGDFIIRIRQRRFQACRNGGRGAGIRSNILALLRDRLLQLRDRRRIRIDGHRIGDVIDGDVINLNSRRVRVAVERKTEPSTAADDGALNSAAYVARIRGGELAVFIRSGHIPGS